jgi:hypothetical protein
MLCFEIFEGMVAGVHSGLSNFQMVPDQLNLLEYSKFR